MSQTMLQEGLESQKGEREEKKKKRLTDLCNVGDGGGCWGDGGDVDALVGAAV